MWTAARRATRVLTVSESSKRDILRSSTCRPTKIDVIYNAYRRALRRRAAAKRTSCACASAISCTIAFVLYAGNIKPHKNLERLIEAFHLRAQARARSR